MVANYDNRRFRTLVDIVIPAGTLVLPSGDGSGRLDAPNDPCGTTARLDIDDGVRVGVIRQLAEGEA